MVEITGITLGREREQQAHEYAGPADGAVSALVENDAWPPESVPVPRVLAPSLNVTVPVLVPGAGLVTVAVRATDEP